MPIANTEAAGSFSQAVAVPRVTVTARLPRLVASATVCTVMLRTVSVAEVVKLIVPLMVPDRSPAPPAEAALQVMLQAVVRLRLRTTWKVSALPSSKSVGGPVRPTSGGATGSITSSISTSKIDRNGSIEQLDALSKVTRMVRLPWVPVRAAVLTRIFWELRVLVAGKLIVPVIVPVRSAGSRSELAVHRTEQASVKLRVRRQTKLIGLPSVPPVLGPETAIRPLGGGGIGVSMMSVE